MPALWAPGGRPSGPWLGHLRCRLGRGGPEVPASQAGRVAILAGPTRVPVVYPSCGPPRLSTGGPGSWPPRRAHVTKLAHRQMRFTGRAFRHLRGCPASRGQSAGTVCVCPVAQTHTRTPTHTHTHALPAAPGPVLLAQTLLPSGLLGTPPTHSGKQSKVTALPGDLLSLTMTQGSAQSP